MKGGKGDSRSKLQMEADKAFVAGLICKGYRCTAITEKLNAERPYRVSERTVRDIMAAARKAWREESTDEIAEHVRRELMLLDYVQIQAVEAWERSHNPEKPVLDVTPRKSLATKAKAKKITHDMRAADQLRNKTYRPPLIDSSSEFLHVILRVSERRAKLLGLDQPTRFKGEHSGPDGTPIPVANAPLTLEIAVVDERVKKDEPLPA